MKLGKNLILLVTCILILTSCALFKNRSSEIYPMSYDQTYEVASNALDDMEPWMLLVSNQKRGLITIGYEEYLGRKEEVTFIVERVAPFKTKVSLYNKKGTPLNQKFFKAIDRYYEERLLTYPS